MRLKTGLKLLAAPLLMAAVAWVVEPGRLIRAMARLDPAWVLAGFACSLVANLCSAYRWQRLARWLGLTLPLPAALRTYFHGVTANALLPGATMGGDVLRATQLVRLGNPVLESGLSVALDRFSGLWVLVALSGLAATLQLLGAGLPPFWHGPALDPRPLGLLAAASTVTLLLLPAAGYWGSRHGLLPRLPEKLRNQAARLLGRPAAGAQYGLQLGLSGLVQGLSIASLICAGRAAGLDFPLWVFAVAAAPIFVMAALPVSFGGWGTRETAAALCLGAFGASSDSAVAASVLYGLYGACQALIGALLLSLPGRRDA